MKRFIIAGLILLGASASGPAEAADFVFGEETKGVTLASGEADLTVRLRLQPRIDTGDIIDNAAGTNYDSETDLYFREIRLEATGHLVKDLTYELTLDGDKWDKSDSTANKVEVLYANVNWKARDYANIFFGKKKLPYSRVSLTSSSKQLIVERPFSTEDAKDVFGKTDPYEQTKLALHGKLAEGMFAYEVAIADGWQNGEAIYTAPTRTVQSANPYVGVRVELSPPGLAEPSKSDAHLGEGKHLTLGVSLASQSEIEYTNGNDEDRALWGVDVSAHFEGVTVQLEYIGWEIDTNDPALSDKEPKGWYAQAGYFIPGLNIEPVARYELYDENSKVGDSEVTNTTLGVNWYAKGHSLKAGLNWVHTEYELNASGRLANDDKDVIQLQGQLYF